MRILNRAKVFFILAAVLFPWPTAWAAGSLNPGSGAVSFRVAGEDFILSGRYFPFDRMALLAEAGLRTVSNENSGIDYRLGAGIRKYILVDGSLAPFLGARFSFFSNYIEATDENNNGVDLDAHFGAEYFLSDRFSVEASMGVGFQTITAGEDHTVFGTARSSLGANFYFP